MSASFIGLSLLAASAYAQVPGAYTPEVHPQLPTQTCTRAHGCVTANTSIVLDSAYRWMHNVGGYDSCVPNGFSPEYCPNVSVSSTELKNGP
jgi:cellulose 1,4-beta-cellobiosidase